MKNQYEYIDNIYKNSPTAPLENFEEENLASPDLQTLFLHIIAGDADTIKAFDFSTLKIGSESLINQQNSLDQSPLYYAVYYYGKSKEELNREKQDKYREIIKVLLKNEADISHTSGQSFDATSYYGTPLNLAIYFNDSKLVRLLLNKCKVEISFNCPVYDGSEPAYYTPLYLAIKHDLVNIVKLLIEAGAPTVDGYALYREEKSTVGYTKAAPHFAIELGRTKILTVLIPAYLKDIKNDTDECCEFLGIDNPVEAFLNLYFHALTQTCPQQKTMKENIKILQASLFYNKLIDKLENAVEDDNQEFLDKIEEFLEKLNRASASGISFEKVKNYYEKDPLIEALMRIGLQLVQAEQLRGEEVEQVEELTEPLNNQEQEELSSRLEEGSPRNTTPPQQNLQSIGLFQHNERKRKQDDRQETPNTEENPFDNQPLKKVCYEAPPTPPTPPM